MPATKANVVPVVLLAVLCLALSCQKDKGENSARYRITDIGTLGGTESRALGINDEGTVVGSADLGAGATHAFLWKQGQMTDLGTFPGDFGEKSSAARINPVDVAASAAFSINSREQIVGNAENGGPGSDVYHAVLWERDQITDLGTVDYRSSSAGHINNAGVVAGYVINESFEQPDAHYLPPAHGFLWSNGVMHPTPTLQDCLDVNDHGTKAGCIKRGGHVRVFLWRPREARELDVLPKTQGMLNVIINESGLVAGTISRSNMEDQVFDPAQAVVWQGKRRALPLPPGYSVRQCESHARGLNASGQIVGDVHQANIYDNRARAVLWEGNSVKMLGSLIRPNSGWTLTQANSINRRGQIVGSGRFQGHEHAFLLSPR